MGIIASFITVTCTILLLVAYALGLGFAQLLHAYSWPISIIFWALLIFVFYQTSKRESNAKERALTISVPFGFLPCYAFTLSAVGEILELRGGFEQFLAVCIELPLCFCFSLLVGIGVNVLAGKFDEAEAIIPVSIIGNIVSAVILVGIGI